MRFLFGTEIQVGTEYGFFAHCNNLFCFIAIYSLFYQSIFCERNNVLIILLWFSCFCPCCFSCTVDICCCFVPIQPCIIVYILQLQENPGTWMYQYKGTYCSTLNLCKFMKLTTIYCWHFTINYDTNMYIYCVLPAKYLQEFMQWNNSDIKKNLQKN